MFSPECKSEFIEGITKCPVCDIKLIDELPPEPEPEFVDYKEILATYNPAAVAFLKSLLDSEEISYFLKGEHFMYVRPLTDPVRFMVRTDQVAQAIDLLQDVKLSITGINLDKGTKNK